MEEERGEKRRDKSTLVAGGGSWGTPMNGYFADSVLSHDHITINYATVENLVIEPREMNSGF